MTIIAKNAKVEQQITADEETVTLDREGIAALREALLIGLGSWGELVRCRSQFDMWKVLGADPAKVNDLRPLLPDGNNDTIGHFAHALSLLGY